MSFLDYICPRCGRKTEYKREYGGLCESCYLEIHGEKINKGSKGTTIEIKQCKICGRIKHGNNWLKPNMRSFQTIFISKLKKQLNGLKSTLIGIDLPEDIDLGSTQLIQVRLYNKESRKKLNEINVRLRVERAICDLCQLKQVGEYYEYIVRLRFFDETERVEREIQLILEELDIPVEDHVKVERIRNGIDLYFTNRRIGESFAKKLATRRGVNIRKFIQRKYFKSLEKNVIIENAIINL